MIKKLQTKSSAWAVREAILDGYQPENGDSTVDALPFVADHRKLIKVGVSFDSEKRMPTDWKVIEE